MNLRKHQNKRRKKKKSQKKKGSQRSRNRKIEYPLEILIKNEFLLPLVF